MEILLILILGAVVAALWSQFKDLRKSHEALQERVEALQWRLREKSPSEESDRTRPIDKPAQTSVPARAASNQATDPAPQSPAPDTPEPAPQPTAEPVAGVEEEDPRNSLDFEELFGRRLPIWAGGITLAIGGIFLVRLAIESGLMTPPVRVAASFAAKTISPSMDSVSLNFRESSVSTRRLAMVTENLYVCCWYSR